MMMKPHASILMGLLAWSHHGGLARACSYANPAPFEVDSAMRGVDVQPPALTAVSVGTIKRGQGSRGFVGCGQTVSTCDDIGSLTIVPTASDDVTPVDRLGYRVSLVAGKLPASAMLPEGATTSIAVYWLDGATDDQEPLDFTLSIVAIDLAGNESAPRTVHVVDDKGGCAVAALSRATSATPAALGLLLLGWAAARRPRARSR